MVTAPFRKISQNWGFEFDPAKYPNQFVVHVGDCEIVPEALYGIRAVNVDTGDHSDELDIETTLFAALSHSWYGDCIGKIAPFCDGDIRNPPCSSPLDCGGQPCLRAWTLPDGAVNFDDVNAALALAAPGPTSVPPEVTWVDLHGNASGVTASQEFDPPNFVVNFSDIQQILFAFSGFPYSYFDPVDCPDSANWP